MRILLTVLLSAAFLVGIPAGAWTSENDSMNKPASKNMNKQMVKDTAKGSMMDHADSVAKAMAVLSGTEEDSTIEGNVKLVETDKGLHVTANLSNVPEAGEHGFHIHAEGSCDDGGKAAGGHFNPHESPHGLWSEDGPENAHPGDMGNILIDENGQGTLHAFLPGLTLTKDELNVDGRAIILHAQPDDFGQPTGNAGGRIACGIIKRTK